MEARWISDPPVLVQMAVPKSDVLCCFTATIDPRDERDPSARSPFHWQTFRCRKLLFTLPVLACPVRGNGNRHVTVVCRSATRAQLLAEYEKHRLGAGEERGVSDGEYSACLQYTLMARLAPLWNPLEEDLLVQGRDMLCRRQPRDAVRLQVNVRGALGVAWLSLTSSRLRLVELHYGDLDVSAPVLERFLSDPLGRVPATCIGKPWVHVLPSLKRGMVMGLSKGIPSECPYQSYTELRRHWKNMYGYRLPESSAGLTFVSVYFQPMGSVLMTYPWPCLTPHRPAPLRCPDPRAVAAAFLGDVATRVSMVCGEPSPVELGTLARPAAGLQSAHGLEQHLAEGGPPANLQGLQALRENTPSPLSSPPPSAWTSSSDDDVLSCPLSIATQRDGTRPTVEWNFLKRAPRGEDNKENASPQETEVGDSSARPRPPPPPLIRPVFRARAPLPASSALPRPSSSWFKPTFNSTPKKPVSMDFPTTASASSTSSARPPVPTEGSGSSCASGSAAPSTLFAPSFKVPANKPIFLPRLKVAAQPAPRQRGKSSAGPGAASPSSRKPVVPGAASPSSRKTVVPGAGPGARPGSGSGADPGSGSGSGPGAAPGARPGAAPGARPGAVPGAVPGAGPGAGPGAAPGARPGAVPGAGPGAGPGSGPGSGPGAVPGASPARKTGTKRPSEAPLVPELTSLAAVKRASIPQLLAWLRDKNVPCRSKDKKAELVDKVMARLTPGQH